MSSVTIEGTLTPAVGVLRRGERKTVQYTERIGRLVANGYVKIVGSDPAPTPVDAELAEPAESATKTAWKAFLDAKGLEYPADATKADLIAGWKHVSGQDESEPPPLESSDFEDAPEPETVTEQPESETPEPETGTLNVEHGTYQG